jgi:hypothetical protein
MVASTPAFIKRRAVIAAIAVLVGAFLSQEATVRHGLEAAQAFLLQPVRVRVHPLRIPVPGGTWVLGPHTPAVMAAETVLVEVATNSTDFWYIGLPTITKAVYTSVFCNQNGADSEICRQAPAMYDAIVAAGVDPALELAHAGNESSFGKGGVGMAPWHNLHGIHGHEGGLGISFYNGASGDEIMQRYDSYVDAVADWIHLIKDSGLYYPERNTPEAVLEIYCECPGPNGKGDYVQRMKDQINGWRAQSAAQAAAQPAPQPAQQAPSGHVRASDTRSYVLQAEVGVNVRAALNANNGRIRHFTLQPGETWSFGRSIAPISAMGYLPVVCGPAGCNSGGGWCDLTAMYVRVAEQIGLQSSFPAHDGVADPRFPGILLNDDGSGGDLTITNTTNIPVTFDAIEEGGTLTITAS